MELQHYCHEHPLNFNEWSYESDQEEVYCSRCGELISSSCFSCMDCYFYLHKQCAEAPSELDHPFHRDHMIQLLKRHPYSGTCLCDFCKKPCENFVYHCSSTCELDLHIKCALLSYKIAGKRVAELQHIPPMVPILNSTENHDEEHNKAQCFACWKPLFDSVYLSPECGFFLHAECVDLSVEINHVLHPQHSLFLQFNSARLPCKICQRTQWRGLVYCCSSCKFVLHSHCTSIPTEINQIYHRKHPLILQLVDKPLPCKVCLETQISGAAAYFCSYCNFIVHIGCVSPPSMIEDKVHHDHPFTILQRQVSLVCDACGTSEDYVPYMCSTCNLLVHKKCISLPPIIRFYRHKHPIFHIYFLKEHEDRMWECSFCYKEVKVEHGSYFCSRCSYIVHVNCATGDPKFYRKVDLKELEEDSRENGTTSTWIEHYRHGHDLALSDEECSMDHFKQCDGCLLPISTWYYHCSICDFFIHKSCADLPLKRHIWFSYLQKPFNLTCNGIFKCSYCSFESSGLAYSSCDVSNIRYCLRCALVPQISKHHGHDHPLFFYHSYKGSCKACGDDTEFAYRCKWCDFNLHAYCMRLPLTVQHRSDEHPLTLTYQDNNDYSEYHYCDICEKERNPKHWLYHCARCDNTVHPNCVIGKYSFIKLGTIYKKEDHPYSLMFVQKVQYYPECHICGKLCLDLSLECKDIGCNYIIHWKCVKPHQLTDEQQPFLDSVKGLEALGNVLVFGED